MKASEVRARMARLPFADARRLVGNGRPLILAPHQDDESLGCGGLIAECVSGGFSPLILFLTDGSRSHPPSSRYPSDRLVALRKAEAREALGRLGLGHAEDVCFLGLPDSGAPCEGPALEAAVDAIAAFARGRGVTSVFAPWKHDPHCDHLAAHEAAALLAARLGLDHFAYPVWGWLLDPDCEIEDEPGGWRIDIRPWRAAKIRAIEAHRSQLGRLDFDIPDPFRLPASLIEVCTQLFEVYLDP
jgi:LmbE family N-acetylglucosaminyl deacetylase